MNIDYIIDEGSVYYILKDIQPTFELKLNHTDLIQVYKLKDDLFIGVYFDDVLDTHCYNNISRMGFITDVQELNDECEKLYTSFDTLKQNNVFEEVDIQHYQQKLNDKIRNIYEDFVSLISDLDCDS